MTSRPILVTGATGYVGGRLIPALLEAGYRVRAMGRSLEKLGCRPWARHERIELVQGDVLDKASLKKAAKSCRAAYYLVHSMIAQKKEFAEADRKAARNMVDAAASEDLERIIYLGGLAGAQDTALSKHLQSRIEVADILQAGPVPTTDLRAPMILGSGSASFEILRYLVEHLPVMTTPRWVFSLNQPIAIRNVVHYLVECLVHDETTGQTYDIGGPDVLTYRKLLDIYAEEAHLRKRWVIPVPVLTPTLSAYWIHLISPVPASIALPLTEGLTSAAVCTENRIQSIIPQKLLSCREAIRLALERVQQQQVDSCWADAGELLEPEWAHCGDADWAGGTILKCGYRAKISAPAEALWDLIHKIGGHRGYYFGDFLWRLRGWIDRLVGGSGLGRGSANRAGRYVGEAVDFWRVLTVEPPHRLVLLSEMKAPGDALLEFQINPMGEERSELELTSRFMPRGLSGLIYWYAFYPFHQLVFAGMLKSIAKKSGKALLQGPTRFTPKLHDSCTLPSSEI
ncbi:MAG: SDR family oxidoreductase [Desulfobacterales bacterium]